MVCEGRPPGLAWYWKPARFVGWSGAPGVYLLGAADLVAGDDELGKGDSEATLHVMCFAGGNFAVEIGHFDGLHGTILPFERLLGLPWACAG